MTRLLLTEKRKRGIVRCGRKSGYASGEMTKGETMLHPWRFILPERLSGGAELQLFQQILIARIAATSVEYRFDTEQAHLPVAVSLCPVKPA